MKYVQLFREKQVPECSVYPMCRQSSKDLVVAQQLVQYRVVYGGWCAACPLRVSAALAQRRG